MTKIFLIRHGETEWNKSGRLQGTSNVALADAGIEQAKLLAARNSFPEIHAIYSSDLDRALATAKILGDALNLPVQSVAGLREINFGEWEGKSISQLASECPADVETFFTEPEQFIPPNGETFLQCQARVFNALKKIVADNENRNAIIVSHGAVIRLIICAALDIPIRRMWSIAQFNTAVSILRVDEEKFTVELLNSTAHLV